MSERRPLDRRPLKGRPLWTAVALLALGAIALWASSGMTWGATRSDGGASGAEVAPALVPTALLGAAGIAAVVALGGRVRQAVGVVLVLAGVAVAFITVTSGPPAAPLALALLGASLLVAAGALLVVRGRSMPKLGSGYQTPGAAKRSADPERDLWNALERGDDPTDRG